MNVLLEIYSIEAITAVPETMKLALVFFGSIILLCLLAAYLYERTPKPPAQRSERHI